MISMPRVGMDVHARETTGVVLDPATGELRVERIVGRPERALEWLESLPRPFRAVYEAGPTGYGLARRARDRGLDVVVCAPGHILRSATDRVKTDRRDAERLARLLVAGELRLVRVPTPEEEQLRDLVRAREDVRCDLMRSRHRISKFLLRRELYYPQAGNPWTRQHRDWLCSLRFADRCSQLAFADQLHAHDGLLWRRDELDRAIAGIVEDSPWASVIGRLRCLRGVDTLTGAGLQAEVCDWQRFSHPKLVTSFFGLVPSEHSTGEKRRQGSITKAGSQHARRLLVEAAWHYRHPPRISAHLARRQRDADPRAVDIAWRCQRRLHQRWQRLRVERGKPHNVTCIAIARELATFCWEIATLE
jgi:transposase